MDVTEFSTFAQNLSVFFIGSNGPEEFTRTLFKEIYLPKVDDDQSEYLHNIEKRTLKAYYYGQNNISYVAKKIAGSLDKAQFAHFLYLDADDSIQRLCSVFGQECEGINSSNFGEKLADRFEDILHNAAKPKSKVLKKVSEKEDISIEETLLIPMRSNNKDVSLVAEVMSVCPDDGCANPLFLRMNGKIQGNYEVVVIEPSVPVSGEENLIALCPECARRYQMADANKIQRMKAIKKRFVEIADMQDAVSQQKIEDDILDVLSKIPLISYPSEPVDLNYEPVMLKQKIKVDDMDLLAQIKVWVNLYYKEVNEKLLQLNIEGKNRFEPFCLQVRLTFLGINMSDKSQREIYDGMIKWLQQVTNGERHACEIVIAYFVQKCEVFDVIAEQTDYI